MRESFIFGIALGLSIGPMAMIIIYRSCTSGYFHGLATGLGVGLADFTYAIIAFSIGGLLVHYLQGHAGAFRLISGFVLLIFGMYMMRKSIQIKSIDIKTEKKRSLFKDFISAYGLTILNPMTIIFFRGFSGQIVTKSTSFVSIILASVALFLGSLIIQSGIALVSGRIKNRINNPKALKYINILASSIVILFALKGLLGR